MTGAWPDPAPPAPGRLLRLFCIGVIYGFLLGLFALMALEYGVGQAAGIFAIIVVLGLLQHAAGWVLYMLPFLGLRWLWRRATGYRPPPPLPPQPLPPILPHWAERAALASGLALVFLALLWPTLFPARGAP